MCMRLSVVCLELLAGTFLAGSGSAAAARPEDDFIHHRASIHHGTLSLRRRGEAAAEQPSQSTTPDGAAASPRFTPASQSPAPPREASPARYIVQLVDAPLADYRGGVPGLAATSPAVLKGEGSSPDLEITGAVRPPWTVEGSLSSRRLDVASPAAQAYLRYLADRQAAFVTELRHVAPDARVDYHYRVATNGVAVRLSPDVAVVVGGLPLVRRVTREEAVVPLMDTSLGQVNAPAAWADSRIGGREGAGAGVRVAVIDSGITAAHAFFTDTGMAAPAGFPTATLTVGDKVYAYAAADVARFTNRKVIVARAYANPEVVTSTNPTSQITPLADGLAGFHGAHVAGSIAGRVVRGGPNSAGTGSLTLSGVAPGAYLMAYKFTNAYTPEILRMIDDAVADGADVINNSWGTSAMNVLDPEQHPVAQAFAVAARAGVVVVAAAGNAGDNGEATLGGPHQMSGSVITVANVQTGRTFAYRVYAADTGLDAALTEHPAEYWDFGGNYDVIEAKAWHGDLCNPINAALHVRNKLVLAPMAQICPTTLITFPIQIPGLEFLPSLLQQLVTAQQFGAKGMVLYSPTGGPINIGQLAQLIQLIPQLQGLQFPPTAMIAGSQAISLTEWADTHASLTLKMDRTPARVLDPLLSDMAAPSSSQGPSPGGAGAALKPDLSAPGTDILSTNTTTAGAPAGYTTASGTSMSSPHVAGAAALVRRAWPGWSPAEVKAALMTTTDPVVTLDADPSITNVNRVAAPAIVQGAGRLNVGRALDPGLLANPPSLNVGTWAMGGSADQTLHVALRDVRQQAEGSITYAVRHEPGPNNTLLAPILPAEVTVPAGGSQDLAIGFHQSATLPPGDYDGRIVLASATHTIRIVYFVRVLGAPKDVLLLTVRRNAQGGGGILPGIGGTFNDTADNSGYWRAALESAGLTYDEWMVAQGARTGTPPLAILQRYGLVLLAAGDGNAPLDQLTGGMTALQMYLLGGGRMLVSGSKWAHSGGGLGLQTSGAMYFLSRYFGGFEPQRDDAPLVGLIRPAGLFSAPISLATAASADAAGNGGTVDIGRPLAKLVTAGTGAVDLGIAAPLVVDHIQPYMHSYLEVEGGSVMTGVTNDATLEHPKVGRDIPWRALFAGFGLEAVSPAPGALTRAQMLREVQAWAAEPADVEVQLTAPERTETRVAITLNAVASSPSGVPITAWRWDAGDRRPFATSRGSSAQLTLSYPKHGTYTIRVEATSGAGHTTVAERTLQVGAVGQVYLPALRRNFAAPVP